jgi:hypothetical protein
MLMSSTFGGVCTRDGRVSSRYQGLPGQKWLIGLIVHRKHRLVGGSGDGRRGLAGKPGLERYTAAFRKNDVDAEVLPTLTADDLKDLGITSIGHRRRLLEAIAVLRPKAAPDEPAVRFSTGAPISPTGRPHTSETTAERRPLSVMFCDLIGSAALSSRLDSEDLREVIRSCQACVASTIQQFNGFIARYVGDGVLIYFGWPQAHEIDAARTGLVVAAAVGETPVAG